MGHALAVALIVVTASMHFAFLAFVVFGGWLAVALHGRPRWLVRVHVVAACYGLTTIAVSIRCPLTVVENWARRRAGWPQLSGTGFIDNYVKGVLYPARFTGLVQAIVAVVVLASWFCYPRMSRRRRRAHYPG